MIHHLVKLPFFKRLIPSLGMKVLRLIKKNKGYYKIGNLDLYLDFLDPVDRQIIIHKKYENDQITVLEEQMKKYNFSYFLDIGSNCGYYSCYFGERFKNLKILAFEPNTLALKKLSKSIRKNSLKNIKLYNFALSDSKKKVKMKSMIKHNYAHTNSSIFDPITDLDLKDYKIFNAITKIGDDIINFKYKSLLFKIDVEGFEIHTLRGFIKNLNQNKCTILIEISDGQFDIVNNFMKKNNFKQIFKSQIRWDYIYTNF